MRTLLSRSLSRSNPLTSSLLAAPLLMTACAHPAQTRTEPPLAVTSVPAKSAHETELEQRVAKLERRIERLTAFLREAVPPELDRSQTYAIPIEPGDIVLGPADAKVTVVEVLEFLCPYCAVVAPSVDQVLAKYPKDVRLVVKYLVIHQDHARPAGLAACAAGKQGKGREMMTALWKALWPTMPGRPEISEASSTAMDKLAARLGLKVAQFRADMEGSCVDWLEHGTETLQRFGVNGTPTFYVNGKATQAGTESEWQALIDAEIATVKASGISPAQYYDKVVIGQGQKQAVLRSPFDD